MELDKKQVREYIARRVAQELKDGYVVNLGIGLPTLVANYIPEGMSVTFQSENGIIGVGPAPAPGEEDKDIVNAGGGFVTVLPGAQFFDSCTSFGIIRGGHVDATVLGALEVDQEGNLANWMVPGKMVPGMGGAMDLVVGANQVIVAMEHTSRGKVKIVKKCQLPLTAAKEVNLIITEKCVLEVTPEGLVLREVSPYSSIEDVKATTEADLIIPEDVKILR
ncbi:MULTISPECIES: 3-oxoacid CoA-transferase subunit B [Fusobacterium]|jgi:acetate CoA/acetoacetate CoA-transferase beta subunit|uniref:CoA transferase subunit B n=1 Tax=Fusobacterium hominis TaxID=2764326 RepID=A0A7G9GUI0_9FUSO|nr:MULTISPECIES: 3-oxoacid CoA-transferase subunit B [Fusobacterium]QNM14462.1 CoA transferase subunit B [Fusobacterium hominis]